MPGMSGFELADAMHGNPQTRHIPIIFVTAGSGDEFQWKGYRSGAVDVLQKPFDPFILRSKVNVFLDLYRHRNAAELLARLKQEVAEREEAQTQLRIKEEELQQARKLESIGALAGGIAHEFNNLLQAILGYTKMAMDEIAPDSQPYEDLEQVYTASTRAAALTRQMLTFGRRESVEMTYLCPNSLITELQSLLKPVLRENIEFHVETDEATGQVHGDPGQLQQTIMNLCLNAQDAMPKGGKLIVKSKFVKLTPTFCEAHTGAKPGPHVLITVTDNGMGMPVEVRERIFDPFYTTKEVGKGTGLGLSIVYGTVQQHGGTIHVYSEPDQGATFRIYLPLLAESVPDVRPLRARDLTPAVAAGDASEIVLLAEDEEIVRKFARRTLQKAGYTVIEAVDGEDAIEKVDAYADSLSIALLDVVMPRKSGHEVEAHIRTVAPNLPVIFCTGYDPATCWDASEVDSPSQVIHKPYDPTQLLQSVRETLDRCMTADLEALCT